MHTALCAFEDRASAERARDRLVEAGFDRRDVHLQHREPETGDVAQDPQPWGGVEHEVAVGPDVLARFSRFFDMLLGQRHPHTDLYARHVHGGRTVVVVDAHVHADVERAQAVLRELEPGDLQAVHRPGQPPLRELVGDRADTPSTPAARGTREAARSDDRAMAANEGAAARRGNASDDMDQVGLRYADKDRPDRPRDED